jgi:hypothetical protein
MPKNTVIILVVVVVLALAGGGFYFLQMQKSNPAAGGNAVTSIKDALSQSVSLECTYTDEQGRTAKTYLKNGAIRSDYTGKSMEESGSMIVKDKKMYTWNNQKQGFMMEIPDVTGTPEQTGEMGKQDPVAELEKYKQSCKPAVVSDSLFTPPADVTFTDYSQMMQQAPQAPGAAGGEMTPEQQQQYQQYMEQYAPTQ